MPKLSDEEQCMLTLMEITGFPMEIKHGLYTYDEEEVRGHKRLRSHPNQNFVHSTSDINVVVEVFNWWKENRNEN
jgi:hypothetical protein